MYIPKKAHIRGAWKLFRMCATPRTFAPSHSFTRGGCGYNRHVMVELEYIQVYDIPVTSCVMKMANVSPGVNQEGRCSHFLPQTSKSEERGGYDCEFMEKPSDAVQGGECPVCLLVLREPCVTDCCGSKFCRCCIERVKRDANLCPLCNKPDYSFIRELALERYLKDLEVWCFNKNLGCEWRGKLRNYEEHLNKTPSSENQVIGCLFVEVECMYECGEWFQRQHITTHQTQECKKRPYSCDYCQDYSSTFEEVITFHYPYCSKHPVDCPNKCREHPFEREEITAHLNDECPFTIVNCSFRYAGCNVQVPRKDMCEHMKDWATHLALVTHAFMRENQDLRDTIKKMNHDCQGKIQAMQDELERLRTTQQERVQATRQDVRALQVQVQTTQDNVKANEKKMKELKLALTRYGSFPKVYRVKSVVNKVYLPSFYTHQHGYKMCICVYPNGYGNGRETHISIFTRLMKGLFDHNLKWPFRGNITIQIVKQVGDHDHVERIIPYNDETLDVYASRLTRGEWSSEWGYHQFLAHTDLNFDATKQTQYIKDNHIIVRLLEMELM